MLATSNPNPTKPALLSVIHLGRGRGLNYEARFACGHVATGVFPFAKASTSRARIERWLFGSNGDQVCGVACREASSRNQSDGARWADLQSETEAIDGDQVA